MGKLMTITIIASLLLMYGKYMADMQQQAMQNLNNISHIYLHAEEVAAQLH